MSSDNEQDVSTLNMLQRKGQKWTSQEDKDLMQLASTSKSVEDIAIIHQRTANAIHARICKNIWEYIDNGLTTADMAAIKYNLSEDDLLQFKQSQHEKNDAQ